MKNKPFQTNAFNIKLFVALAIIGGLVIACNKLVEIQPFESAQAKELSFPKANYYLITIVNGQLTAFQTREKADNEWLYTNEREQTFNRIDFTSDANCVFGTIYYVDEVLPDGRLQLWKLCRMGSTESQMKTLTFLAAYDWATGKMEELAGPLPLGSSHASWNPDQSKGIVYLDSGFAMTTLYAIWKNGFGPLDIVVKDQGKFWNLKNFFPDFPDPETLRSGNTGRAVWSPDGHTIAFFAAPDAIGKTEFGRFYVEYNLYLMDANQLEPKAVLDNTHFPFIMEWSPDSKYLAFIGQSGKSEEDGIWLYSVEEDTIVNIATGKFQDILWNPEKTSLFAIKCDDDYCSQILEYDLEEVIHP
jgi:dipeptidyl aminopeptidase/acylaminoacyl peptidase